MKTIWTPGPHTPPPGGGPNAERAHAYAREASLPRERGAR